MSCPPKFKDLHKAADDAMDKDFHLNCFNNKMSQNYDMGEKGSGAITQKLNYNTTSGTPSAEFEFKHKCGPEYKVFNGTTVTKTFNSGSGDMKAKMEKNCSLGKFTFESTFGAGLGKDHFSFKKPALTFDIGKEKATTQLQIKPLNGFSGVDNASLNTVFAAGPAHIGLSAAYGFEKGSIDHAVKLAKSVNGTNFALGVKNADKLELVLSKNLGKQVSMGSFCAFTLTALHSKSQYSIGSGDWGSQLCFNYDNASCGGLNFGNGKMKVDLKTMEYQERATLKISDNLKFSFGAKSKLDGDFFSNFKIGSSMEFSA